MSDECRRIEYQAVTLEVESLNEPARIAATVVLPPAELLPDRPVICFAKPGSTYSRRYYTSAMPGGVPVSQADWHGDRGWIFVALDVLGTGDSSLHAEQALKPATIVEAAQRAEQKILLELADGGLCEGFPPVIAPVCLGLGHSMGACLTIVQQAYHHCYDAIAVLGFSPRYNRPVSPPGMPEVVVPWYSRGAGKLLNRNAVEQAAADGQDGAGWEAYRWTAFYDDVAPDIVEGELARLEHLHAPSDAVKASLPHWASATMIERFSRAVLSPSSFAAEAAAIAVPVLSARGERDIVVDHANDASAFMSSPNIDLFTCPRMGHVHNFASSRELLWQRIHHFGEWCTRWRT